MAGIAPWEQQFDLEIVDDDTGEIMEQQMNAALGEATHDTSNAAAVFAELTKPFPRNLWKHNAETGLDYIPYQAVVDRLNHATGHDWHNEVTRLEFVPWPAANSGTEQLLVVASVRVTIPVLGVSHEHIGFQVGTKSRRAIDLWKGAPSDAIKKCAQAFGVPFPNGDVTAEDLPNPQEHAQEVHQQYQQGTQQPRPAVQQPPQVQSHQQQGFVQQSQSSGAWDGPMPLDTSKWPPSTQQISFAKSDPAPITDGQKRGVFAVAMATTERATGTRDAKLARSLIEKWCDFLGAPNQDNLTKRQAGLIMDAFGQKRD